MPIALLLAMQAAGMIVDYIGTRNQAELARMGYKVQQAGIEMNLQQARLETEDASLQSMISLRQRMGTQIATFAARGTNTGAGSAFSMLNESVGNFKSDERMRRLNLLGREATIKAGGTIAKLNQQAQNAKLWQSFASRSLQNFSSSAQAWQAGAKSFGMTQMGGT